ncbi:hypothetical protein [Nonomuraea sp. NPDC048901]|uniref:hypothetical protein n=1 Tax=Nonomuraea sp. NPDC048901 TaxID=3155627 RepID=UPI0033F0B9DA
MAMFKGARIEVHDEVWGEDHGDTVEFGLTVAAWGRTAAGHWLTRDDARSALHEEDIDVLMENDGSAFISEEGKEQVVDRLAQAFPGSEVHYYSDDEEDGGELDVAGKAPIFEVEFRWEGIGTD